MIRWAKGARTQPRRLTVAAAPRMSASLLYGSGTLRYGTTVYQVFHRTHHQPVFRAKASLAQAGGCYQATVWRYSSHAWKAVRTRRVPARRQERGYATYTLPWASLPDNGPFRVRTHYAPPRTAALGTAAWSAPAYFTVKAP